jgi:hypothetical protein
MVGVVWNEVALPMRYYIVQRMTTRVLQSHIRTVQPLGAL